MLFNKLLEIDKVSDSIGNVNYREAVRAVIVRGNKILMVHSTNRDYKFPGGGIKKGENRIDALKREVKEETGYDLKFTFLGVQENFLRKDNKDIMQYVFLYESIYDGNTSSFVNKDNDSQMFTFIDINKLDEYNIVPHSNVDIIKNHKVHTVEKENN